MRNRNLIVWAVVLVTAGVVGLFATFLLLGVGQDAGRYSSVGEQIYYTGADANGPIPRAVSGAGMMRFGGMGTVACVNCHGQDGRGGRIRMMMGTIDVPDIRYSTLTTTHSVEGTTVPAWTDQDIARAIRDGIEPSGQALKVPMPRWDMTDAEIKDVIAYLKELSQR